LVKVATSPFSLLGAMFGGGEELQYVDFTPGDATLDATQTNKLNTLAKALFERPALSLEISASVDPAADGEMASRQKLKDKMKSLRLQELTARGKPAPALSEFQLEPKDYERLLRRTYKEAFKTDPERALREARETAATTNASIASSTRPPREMIKGAMQLIQTSKGQATAEASKAAAAPISGITLARAKTADELVLEEMERRLMATSPASDDDLRELMQQRSASVQKFLLDTGKVAAERMFLVGPKPFDPNVKGMARVTFSLN